MLAAFPRVEVVRVRIQNLCCDRMLVGDLKEAARLRLPSMAIPDYPPNRKPEDEVPGPALRMTDEQARFIGLFVGGVDGASSVEVEERGEGYFKLRVFDKLGEQVAGRMVFPHGNELP